MAIQRIGDVGDDGARVRARSPRLFCRAIIRPADRRDAARIAAMANALALSTAGQPGRMTAGAVVRDLLGDDRAGCLVADRRGLGVGYALWSPAYETAFAARGVYLSDLYVEPEHRGAGIGRALMAALARRCEDEGGRFIWWSVAAGSAAAERFYDALGATSDPVNARAVFEAPFQALLQDG